MDNFKQTYSRLNSKQRAAVDQIDGPVLVLAGPGTGKTQLLSARVANILDKTDSLPQNILCLTFTESGAANMRSRLTQFIGQASYDVEISTYHAFGGSLIRRFPEYFGQTRLQEPADELTQHQIVQNIVDALTYKNPLKQTRHHLRDLISTLSETKRALLSPSDIRLIAKNNQVQLDQLNPIITRSLSSLVSMSAKHAMIVPMFEAIQQALSSMNTIVANDSRFATLATLAGSELAIALDDARQAGKNKPLTAWKDAWLIKNSDNQFVLSGALETKRLSALADVVESYQAALESRGLYDFDDMILRSITALETHDDLRFTLQEQYQYLLLDEFQDTNAAQFKLIELLTNNPVNEGRPNVLAVGDDDQAIYAFQGAHYSNMLDFYNAYRDTVLVNLDQNYRSHPHILTTAQNIADQIEVRLHHSLPGVVKTLSAAAMKTTDTATIDRQEYVSDISQNQAIADQIHQLIVSGVEPSEIAILAPKHKYLEPLVPYLNHYDIPVRYDKREDILTSPIIHELLTMARLLLALQSGDEDMSASLWSEILSYEFWQLPVEEIWQLSWQLNDDHYDKNWTAAMLENPSLKSIALLFMTLANRTETLTCEELLDALIGTTPVSTGPGDDETARSNLRSYYTSKAMQDTQPDIFYETLSHLTVLRTKLREHQATNNQTLTIKDLIELVELYHESDTRMLNTSPYNQQTSAVQLMTVFKAKGLEFAHVFLPSVHDDVWGESSRSNSNRLTLPKNLAPIRHSGATQDERLRAFFVAITRAKHGLHLFSYQRSFSGKQTKRLKYLDEREQDDKSFRSTALAEPFQQVKTHDNQALQLSSLELGWQTRHLSAIKKPELASLLQSRLERYQLSPTHLNSFTDMEYGGPEAFFFNTLLRFPSAPTASGQFGNAVHETLEWVQHQLDVNKTLSVITDLLPEHFSQRLKSKHLSAQQYNLELERGLDALKNYLKQREQMFAQKARAEHNFRDENVFVGDAHLAGKIDRMEINDADKTIVVVDYKTGRPYSKWESSLKLHKYRTQLYCYKILIERSRTYKGYTVVQGRLEFIEPDNDGRVLSLSLDFNPTEEQRTKSLIKVVWSHIMALDLPNVTGYNMTLSGTKSFESNLIAGGEPTNTAISKSTD